MNQKIVSNWSIFHFRIFHVFNFRVFKFQFLNSSNFEYSNFQTFKFTSLRVLAWKIPSELYDISNNRSWRSYRTSRLLHFPDESMLNSLSEVNSIITDPLTIEVSTLTRYRDHKSVNCFPVLTINKSGILSLFVNDFWYVLIRILTTKKKKERCVK